MAKDIAIVLNNGSVNSLVTTALAAQRYRPVMVHMLKGNTDDSEEGASRLRAVFEQQVSFFKPYRDHVLPNPSLPQTAASSSKTAPAGSEAGPSGVLSGQLVELLPLLASAARLALQYQASAIYVGSRTGSDPDDLAQATEFFQIYSELLNTPCGLQDLEIATPLLEMDPWQVVDLGFQVGAPLERSWSCTGDGAEPCWACRGCRAREAAFQQAAKPDPMRAVRR